MSNYITRDDYLVKIRNQRLTQLLDTTGSVLLDDAEATALQVIKDALFELYDVDTIFSQTGANRDKQVVRWVCNLAIYYLHERLPDNQIPEHVSANYEETMDFLKALELGKRSVQLPRKQDSTGQQKTKLKWGSAPRRGQ